MIVPTNGRIVWYTPSDGDGSIVQLAPINQPLAAQICHVWSERCVNLRVTDSIGGSHVREAVILLQDDEQPPVDGRYAAWMPYQKRQAAREGRASGATEAALKANAETIGGLT